MALAIDASSPSITSGTTAGVTTAAFTTPAAVFLVALCGRNTNAGTDGTGTVSGAGLTWTLAGRKGKTGATGQIAGGTAQDGCVEVWWAYSASALTSQTVTSTRNTGTGIGSEHSLQVEVLTGAETTWGGAIAANAAASAAPTVTVTTTQAGSWIFGVISDWNQAGLGTAGSGVTIISEYNPSGQITIHNLRETASTSSSGTAVTINLTAPATEQYNMLGVEIRASAGGAAILPRLTVVRQAPMRASLF